MERITHNFLVLVGAATLASGGLWQQTTAFDAGTLTPLGAVIAFGSLVLLSISLVGAGRILHVIAIGRPTDGETTTEGNNE